MKITPPKSKQPIPKTAKRVFKGILFDIYQWQQSLFDGTSQTFEKIKRPATVMVLPVINDKIILAEQEQPVEGKFIGAIGGRVDEGEDILAAAQRELLEETGLKAQNWLLWDAVQLVNKIDWPVYTFIAKNCQQVTQPNLDGGEKVKLFRVTFFEFVNLVSDDNFRDFEIALKVLRAKNHQDRFNQLKKDFSID